MHRGQFGLALLLLIGLTFFVYHSYPESWRRHRFFRVLLFCVHVLGAFSLTCIMTVYSQMPVEEAKRFVSVAGTLYYVVVVMLSILFFARFVLRSAVLFVARRTNHPPQGRLKRVIDDTQIHSLVFLLVSYALAVVGFFNIGIVHPNSYDIQVNKASTSEPLTISLIADTHVGAGGWKEALDQVPDLVNASDPDVLFIAGDVFDETTCEDDVKLFQTVIERVHPRLGTYFIYGNHDDFHDDWAARQLRAMGVKVLEDELLVLGDDIQVVGRLDPKDKCLDLDALFEKLAVDPEKPLLVLTHRPTEFARMAGKGVDLVMAGHTHGFNIPQFMATGLGSDMFQGLGTYGEMKAIVTSGVAAWGFHYKWPAQSEVVTIHLSFAGA